MNLFKEVACQDTRFADMFFVDIKGFNIEKCRIAVSKDKYWNKRFEEYFIKSNDK